MESGRTCDGWLMYSKDTRIFQSPSVRGKPASLQALCSSIQRQQLSHYYFSLFISFLLSRVISLCVISMSWTLPAGCFPDNAGNQHQQGKIWSQWTVVALLTMHYLWAFGSISKKHHHGTFLLKIISYSLIRGRKEKKMCVCLCHIIGYEAAVKYDAEKYEKPLNFWQISNLLNATMYRSNCSSLHWGHWSN